MIHSGLVPVEVEPGDRSPPLGCQVLCTTVRKGLWEEPRLRLAARWYGSIHWATGGAQLILPRALLPVHETGIQFPSQRVLVGNMSHSLDNRNWLTLQITSANTNYYFMIFHRKMHFSSEVMWWSGLSVHLMLPIFFSWHFETGLPS